MNDSTAEAQQVIDQLANASEAAEKKRRISKRYKRKPTWLKEAPANPEEDEPQREGKRAKRENEDEFNPEVEEKPKTADDPAKPKKFYERKSRKRVITRRIHGQLPPETVLALRTVDWKELDFIGMEIKGANEIKEEPFTFDEMNKQLNEGELKGHHPLYLFMGAQPFTVEGTVIVKNIPYIIIIDCAKPPSNKVAVASIQSGGERIESFSKWHLAYVPYLPRRFSYATADTPPQLHTLKWEARRTVVNKFDQEKAHKVSLLLPYELLPRSLEDYPLEKRLGEVKNVDFKFKAENGHEFDIVWDKDTHHLVVDIDSLLEEEKLPETERPRIKAALKEQFEKKRQEVRDKFNAEKSELEALKKEEYEALKNIRLYKFYPEHPSLDIRPFMVANINRYYGDAHKVFPVVPDMVASKSSTSTSTSSTSNGKEEILPISTQQFSVPTFTVNNSVTSAPSTGFVFPTTSAPTSGFVFPTTGNTGFTGFQAPIVTSTSTPSTGFVFNPSATQSTQSSDQWKCACCEAMNSSKEKACVVCMTTRK